MILQVLLLLASALQILTYAAFMNFMLEPRFAPRLNFWLTAGGYLLAAVVSRLLEAHTLAKLLSANGLALLLVFVFFRSSVWHKLFALLYTWVTVFALDMGAMILCVQWLHLSEYEILTNPAVRLGVTYFNYVATLALWLIPIMRKLHRTTPLQRQTVKRFVFYPLGHLLLIVGFYWLVEQYPSPRLAAYFALACLYCIVVNIFLLKTMTDTAKKAELERKLQVMEYEKDRQMMEYDVLQEKERAVARLAHDYKNQLAVGLTLLEQKDYDRLADQLRDLSDSLTTTETVHFCANPVVNAVLANKAALCRRENITLEASLDVPEATGLSDGELCSVFANLLDNAIKAVRPLPPDRRRILVKARGALGRRADDAIVEQVHPARRALGAGLRLMEPEIKAWGGLLFGLGRAVRRTGGAQHLQPVAERRQNRLEILPCCFFAAGQVDDQAAAADARDPAREAAARRDLAALAPHQLRQTRRGALDQFRRGLRRDVARGKAGAARGQDELHAQLVRSMADHGLDLFFLIGDKRPLHDLTFILRQKRAEHRPARVHPFAARALVADGDDCCGISH